MSNVGKWAPWYDRGAVVSYGDTASYAIAAEWLSGLAVEDWGCGCAEFRKHHDAEYWGVDGTAGWADEVDDLATRRSVTPAVMLRHVLEHNSDWRKVLRNAVASAKQRIVIVTFIPDGDGSQVGWTDELGVPDIAVPHDAVDKALRGWTFDRTTIESATAYGMETIWRAAR